MASAAYAIMRCPSLRLTASVCLSVCPSVHVSVTFVHSVKTNKDIFEFFFTILIFAHQNGMTIFQWEHPPPWTGASNAGGVGRNRDSEPISGLTACVNAATGRCCKRGRWWTTATASQVVTHRWYSKRRCWLREKTTKCLWQEASTLRQLQRI